MKKNFHFNLLKSKLIITDKNIIFILIIVLNIISPMKTECTKGIEIDNNNCFNDLIIIKKNFRAGHFATNKKGDMIIEYSNDAETGKNKRLFYGLNKNGRNFFNGEKFKEKIVENPVSTRDIQARYEARNIFVSLENDKEKDKEYLFSTSCYETLTELHDLEGDEYKSRETIEFFDIIDIFSFQYSLFGLQQNDKNVYYCIFTQHEIDKRNQTKDNTWQLVDYSKTYTIKKFSFNSFDLVSYNQIACLNNTDNFNNRIISSFVLEQYNIIVVFFVKKVDDEVKNGKYSMIFYDFDLNKKNEIEFANQIEEPRSGEGVFSKCLYLKENYGAFIYYTKGYDDIKIPFEIYKFTQEISDDVDTYSFESILSKDLKDVEQRFISDVPLNDFVKVDENRLIFISTVRGNIIDASSDKYNFTLHILFLDLYQAYTKLKIRQFYFDLSGHQIRKELTGYIYNGYFVLTATVVKPQSYISEDYFSILIFFGYANGTDFEIDIYPYLMDIDDYDTGNNLFNFLIEKLKIDNNIFKYEKIDMINLVAIPDELLFYNKTDGNKDETKLIHNNDFFGPEHFLAQNLGLNKENKYYFLDYQYIIQEPDYDTFYNTDNQNVINNDDSYNYESSFHRKIFYGRTNRLKFKLCYEYCESCEEFGHLINKQKCLTCLENYKYDYWYYLNKPNSNCIPEDKFYDDEGSKDVIDCDNTFKYFYPEGDKKICFKNNLECPDDFPYFNSSSNECENIRNPPSTISEENQSTSKIKESTNIIESESATMESISTISTTTKTNIESTNIKTTQFSNPICSFDSYKNNTCTFLYNSNPEILSKLRDILNTYPGNGAILSVSAREGYAFQIADTLSEKWLDRKNNLTVIDLEDCEQKLKEQYHIDPKENLIILSFEKLTNSPSEKSVKYEVYNPITLEKLELSYCEDTEISIYIPLNLSEKTSNLYKNLMEQGYDPFNINDKFYREICTPYTSENGTDVLLDDREEYIYNSIVNETLCPDNCEYSAYLPDEKYLKCECSVNNSGIDTLDITHISGKNIYKSFLSTMKYSNYKVMICYNLVFNLKIFMQNYGSLGTLLLFVVYIIFLIYYAFKGISSLRVNISKLMFETPKETNEELKVITEEKFKRKTNDKQKRKTNNIHKNKKKDSYPPKRRSTKKLTKATMLVKETEENEFIPNANDIKLKKGKRRSFKLKSKADKNKIVSPQVLNLKTSGEELNDNKIKEADEKEKQQKQLDNFELNNLEYEEASELDKRSFCKTYLSVLMREHLILFTFFSCNDYNIFYIKIERFFISVCTDMSMKGLFFINESMHRKYAENEDFTFIQKLPQLLFTLIVSHAIEVLLCFFSMTDTAFYEIKSLPKTKENQEKIVNIIKCVKNKLIGFYIFTILLFLFYWYFISAFCAVYQNTQIIFLRDSAISFLISCIDPFIIYAFTCLLRMISLSALCKKKLGCVYKLSDIIPIF